MACAAPGDKSCALIAAIVALLAAEATAAAGHSVLGDHVGPRSDGLYAVGISEGSTLLTHGPDPAAAAGPRDCGGHGGPQRGPVCGTDRYTYFLLARPRGRPGAPRGAGQGGARHVRRRARVAVRRANALLNASSVAAGGPSADLEVMCDARGRAALSPLRYRRDDFASLVRIARRRGFDYPATDYVILVRGRNAHTCGAASFEGDARLSFANLNNIRGGYAIVYRRCWTRRGPAARARPPAGCRSVQGAVLHRAGRHCWDERDVMCYAPDGGDLHQAETISRCATISFDWGNDTYFDPTPEPGEWLEEHWTWAHR
jgi:hypothetical protein